MNSSELCACFKRE